ncbi:MAG: hypothetical protein HKL91_02785 [Candidatus Eremiobacteraeota bacterium]|uniref:Uncharacterized protein n=1 Tax=mine drainage metagenome TaxID=410659 RepID=E6PIN5_9ZZZZ|nr:hypothetical protein [Candidatus Eremiobacteraeota bacterium]
MKLLRVLAMLVVAVFASSALADASINLHNGYISLQNSGSLPVHVVITPQGFGAITMFDGVIPPHSVYHANNCCYLAGTLYNVHAYYGDYVDHYLDRSIRPRLCNTRGIPFGYASLLFDSPRINRKSIFMIQLDHGCP